jgi:acetyltransferase-like isoleucine patch superfamily enzyme
MGGVKIKDYKKTFIGKNVSFDTVAPELITVEPGVRITENSAILTHFLNPDTNSYTYGSVVIKKGAFIGTSTIITKPITIGEGAVVGAGSVVTKNIPDMEIWAGNPARFIRKRS